MNETGIWPRFTGRGMHDRLAAYDGYDCDHSVCGAHLLRDCQAVAEQEQQPGPPLCTISCLIKNLGLSALAEAEPLTGSCHRA